MHIKISKNYLSFSKYKVKCALGKRGIGNKKKEGDLITPKGRYKIKYVLYRKDRLPSLQTKLRKIPIKKKLGWCNDPRSKKYNKIVHLPSKYTFEKLYKLNNIYDVILVLNFNMSPIKKNKGSAIFIHISKKDYKKTEGCVAIKKKHILQLAKKINTNTIVTISDQK